MKTRIFILAVTAFLAGPALAQVSNNSVMLEVENGDTAFVVNEKAQKAWWVVGECRREIPIEKQKNRKKNRKSKSLNQSMVSEVISEEVQIGRRQVELRQQYRFNLDTSSVTVEVYNSLRGGWTAVPVRLNAQCAQDASCRSRMEYPEC